VRTFDFVRDVDRSGISGTGVVAQGVAYDDGVVAMHWLTQYRSTAIYPDIETLVAIHGHDGCSRIEWHGA
jgi:hypothetical protein